MSMSPIFHDYTFADEERQMLDRDGHYVLPELLTDDAQEQLTESLARIQSLIPGCKEGHEAESLFCRI